MRRTRLWRVTFMPWMGRDSSGNPAQIGRRMCFVTAESLAKVDEVVEHFLAELHVEGYEVQEEIIIPAGHGAWSVSIGNPCESIMVTAPDPESAEAALVQATLDAPRLRPYVEERAFTTRKVEDREGVW